MWLHPDRGMSVVMKNVVMKNVVMTSTITTTIATDGGDDTCAAVSGRRDALRPDPNA